jgi:hypothetical protein
MNWQVEYLFRGRRCYVRTANARLGRGRIGRTAAVVCYVDGMQPSGLTVPFGTFHDEAVKTGNEVVFCALRGWLSRVRSAAPAGLRGKE